MYAALRLSLHYSHSSAGCPEWSERVDYEHGYLRFTALNSTALAYEYVASINRTVIDRMLIVQDLAAEWVH